jgi:hypothetical protein
VDQDGDEVLHQPDPPTGSANASIQICPAGSTVSLAPSCGPEPVPGGPTLVEIWQLPAVAIAIVGGLANSDRGPLKPAAFHITMFFKRSS